MRRQYQIKIPELTDNKTIKLQKKQKKFVEEAEEVENSKILQQKKF